MFNPQSTKDMHYAQAVDHVRASIQRAYGQDDYVHISEVANTNDFAAMMRARRSIETCCGWAKRWFVVGEYTYVVWFDYGH